MDGHDILADLLGSVPEWQERALCAQTDPEAFFPEKGGSTREAKRICSRCEVTTECLEYAMQHDERFGIWGGMSERERRKIKRRANEVRLAAAAAAAALTAPVMQVMTPAPVLETEQTTPQAA